jgi:hypothetical protein
MTNQALMVLAALAVLTANGQQAATPQPTQQAAATTPAPCNSSAPSKPHQQGWLEKKARAIACAKNPNLCSLPSSTDDAMGTTQSSKPCAQIPAPKTPVPAVAPQPPAPTAKPALVCPPKTVLIANTRYCLAADNTTVDAIQLPPNQQIPAAPQK